MKVLILACITLSAGLCGFYFMQLVARPAWETVHVTGVAVAFLNMPVSLSIGVLFGRWMFWEYRN